jgi:molybdopterin synthase catalytic subunit
MTTFNTLAHAAISLDALLELDGHPDCGGLAMFVGTVRQQHLGRAVTGLTYTAHEAVAARMIAEIEQQARTRFGVPYCRVQHRLGALTIGDVAIACVVRAPHRAEAFEACRWAVDAVKHGVPVWKEEFYENGDSEFVQGCCIRDDFDDDATHHQGHTHA